MHDDVKVSEIPSKISVSMTRRAIRATTVIYPRADVLRNTGFKTAAGCTAVTRQLTEERG